MSSFAVTDTSFLPTTVINDTLLLPIEISNSIMSTQAMNGTILLSLATYNSFMSTPAVIETMLSRTLPKSFLISTPTMNDITISSSTSASLFLSASEFDATLLSSSDGSSLIMKTYIETGQVDEVSRTSLSSPVLTTSDKEQIQVSSSVIIMRTDIELEPSASASGAIPSSHVIMTSNTTTGQSQTESVAILSSSVSATTHIETSQSQTVSTVISSSFVSKPTNKDIGQILTASFETSSSGPVIDTTVTEPSTTSFTSTSSSLSIKTTAHMISSIVTSSSSVSPSSTITVPDEQLVVTLIVSSDTDIESQDFKDKVELGLVESYMAGSISRTKRSIKKRRQANEGVNVKITDIKRTSNKEVDVQFQVYRDGGLVPAAIAEATYSTLSDNQMSAFIGYPVASPIVAVQNKVPAGESVNWTDLNGPLIIILIVVPSALVIIATVILLYMHCFVTTRSWRLAEDKSSFGDNSDIEKGEVLGEITSTSSTFQRHSVTFNLDPKDNFSFRDERQFDSDSNLQYNHDKVPESFSEGELFIPEERRSSFDITGDAKTHMFSLPRIPFETESTAFNVPGTDSPEITHMTSKYKSNNRNKRKKKKFKRRNSGFPFSTSNQNISIKSDEEQFDIQNDIEYFTVMNENEGYFDNVCFDGHIPYHIPRPQVSYEQSHLDQTLQQKRPIAPYFETPTEQLKKQRNIFDKNHPGKLVFSSDYIFDNEIDNPISKNADLPREIRRQPTALPQSDNAFPENENRFSRITASKSPPYRPVKDEDSYVRITGLTENASSTEDNLILQFPYQDLLNQQMAMDLQELLTAGHVEQLAKMSRLPKSSDLQNRSIPPVKLRTVTYRPPEPAKETTEKQKHDLSSDSNTDIDTPRPPTESNKPLFQKNFDSRKENRRRRVFTKRERDRMRRHGQMYSDDSHDDVMSEINFRHMRGYNSGRSGYSTPGGSVDEMKLGRNMRAAPRRMETKDGVRMTQKNSTSKPDDACSQPLLEVDHNLPQNIVTEYYNSTHLPHSDLDQRQEVKPLLGSSSISPQHPTQDLIEILNRRQQLLQQQRETRKKFIAEQEAKEKAKQIVNLAYLGADTLKSRKEERKRESEKLLDDAFSLTRQDFQTASQNNNDKNDDVRSNDGIESPRGQGSQSAINQLWSNGHIQEDSTKGDNKGDDFFEQGTTGMETEDHMIKYVRDELQRLET